MTCSTRAPSLAAASITSTTPVGVVGAFPRGLDHRPVEPAVGGEDARRVDQQDLRVAFDRDAHQPRAGGLRLGADDRDLLPDQRIDQRRLARVGRAEHGDEAAALAHCNFSSSAAAAAVSASCFEAPSASASPWRPSADLDLGSAGRGAAPKRPSSS